VRGGIGRRAQVLLAVAAAALLALGGVATAAPKIAQVKDDVFTPLNVRVAPGGSVKWKWVNTIHPHNVRLTQAPVGVKKANFWSQTSSSPTYTFTRKFTKLGKYHFICSIHPVKMQMNVNVRK
jgi:plastocyanin